MSGWSPGSPYWLTVQPMIFLSDKAKHEVSLLLFYEPYLWFLLCFCFCFSVSILWKSERHWQTPRLAAEQTPVTQQHPLAQSRSDEGSLSSFIWSVLWVLGLGDQARRLLPSPKHSPRGLLTWRRSKMEPKGRKWIRMSSSDLTPRKQAGKATGKTEPEHWTSWKEAAQATEGSAVGSWKLALRNGGLDFCVGVIAWGCLVDCWFCTPIPVLNEFPVHKGDQDVFCLISTCPKAYVPFPHLLFSLSWVHSFIYSIHIHWAPAIF